MFFGKIRALRAEQQVYIFGLLSTGTSTCIAFNGRYGIIVKFLLLFFVAWVLYYGKYNVDTRPLN